MSRNAYRTLGVLFWGSVSVAMLGGIKNGQGQPDSSTPQAALVQYFAGPSATVAAIDPTHRLRVYDPVFFQADDGEWSQIGFVKTVASRGDAPLLIAWHQRDLVPMECELIQYRNSGRLEEVVATMLPPEKRLQIQQRLASAMTVHGDELSAAFVPLVQASLSRSLPVIEAEFHLAVQRHRSEIDELAGRWNEELVEQRLIPLARREILPIVRHQGEPVANAIGRELWDRASLWRFGWRAVYDKSPLPRQNLLHGEWDRFVDEEAVPVLESHMDDVVHTIQQVVVDVAANEAVRKELGVAANAIAADPRARELVQSILKETLVDNQRLREVWGSVWSSDEARQALEMAGDRLEPVVRQMGDDLFGSQEQGITPGFARVLRNQILGKDRRWLVAVRSAKEGASYDARSQTAQPPLEIIPARQSMPYPVVHTAADFGGAK